jgi:hypothetical protein
MREVQEFLPGPDVVGQPDGHRRRPRPIPPPLRQALPQRITRASQVPVVFAKAWVLRVSTFHRSRHTPFHRSSMHRIGAIHCLSQNRTHLHAHHPALMTALDGLRQPHPGRGRQGRTPPLSCWLRVPIDPTNRPSVDRLSIADPDHAPSARCALAGVRHPLRRDLILRRPKAPRHPKTSRPVRTPTSPTRAHPARRGGRISSIRRLFWTKDPKASTSTSLQCRSWTSTWGMVSSLWPVISSAALRPPPAHPHPQGARQRSIAVPRVGPNERWQFRHTQRGRPPLLPFWIPWVAPQRGQGGLSGLGFRAIFLTSASPLAPIIPPSTTQGGNYSLYS